jgi:hypothetical protein
MLLVCDEKRVRHGGNEETKKKTENQGATYGIRVSKIFVNR